MYDAYDDLLLREPYCLVLCLRVSHSNPFVLLRINSKQVDDEGHKQTQRFIADYPRLEGTLIQKVAATAATTAYAVQ